MAEETDETVYDEEGRNEMVDDAEISPEEEGFMQGYDQAAEEKENEEPEDDKKEKKEDNKEE
ncbi:MAG: hypothetical protein KAU20_00325 [Nanoarchaeota archaeon]|nr:hypothetical protein [Nanoarchaeota archaeon]